jgi:hypothetical protein
MACNVLRWKSLELNSNWYLQSCASTKSSKATKLRIKVAKAYFLPLEALPYLNRDDELLESVFLVSASTSSLYSIFN